MSCPERCYFNPRAPRGARLRSGDSFGRSGVFQSTRPSRGATVFHQKNYQQQGISIHAPLAGRDRAMICARLISKLFQSTRPSRGATGTSRLFWDDNDISIHAPLAGRDRLNHVVPPPAAYFNPRAPRGARREEFDRLAAIVGISIHAPLAGRDALFCNFRPCFWNFNPRAPRGARLCVMRLKSVPLGFQSTRPSRGATIKVINHRITDLISIHAPLAGRDLWKPAPGDGGRNFNPRAPRGARRCWTSAP